MSPGAQLGHLDEGRKVFANMLEITNDVSIGDWRERLPFNHEPDLGHMVEGWRNARLPE